jgi:hypothetical protein
MLCQGCGLELPARSGPGRPARYHGPRCRQSAHRARVASEHGELLGALEALARDIGTARQAVLAGAAVPVGVRERIGATAAVIAGPPGERATVEPDAPAEQEHAEQPVTEPVTKSPESRTAVAEPAAPRRTGRRRARIDPNTARVGKRTDDHRYPVVAGPSGKPFAFGLLEPVWGGNGRVKAWRGKLDGMPVNGTWPSRDKAAVELAHVYERRRLEERDRDRQRATTA